MSVRSVGAVTDTADRYFCRVPCCVAFAVCQAPPTFQWLQIVADRLMSAQPGSPEPPALAVDDGYKARSGPPLPQNGEAAHRLGYCTAHASQSCAMQTCASVRSSLPWHTSDCRRTSSTSFAFAPRSPPPGLQHEIGVLARMAPEGERHDVVEFVVADP